MLFYCYLIQTSMLTKTGYQLNKELQKSKTIKIHFLFTSQDNARRWGLGRVNGGYTHSGTYRPSIWWPHYLSRPRSPQLDICICQQIRKRKWVEGPTEYFRGYPGVVGRILRCSRGFPALQCPHPMKVKDFTPMIRVIILHGWFLIIWVTWM